MLGEGKIEHVEDLPPWVLVWLLFVSCQTPVEPPFSWSGDVSDNQTRPRKPLREVVEHIPSSHSDIMNRIYIYVYIYISILTWFLSEKLPKQNEYSPPPLGGTSPVSAGPAWAITCWAQLPHPHRARSRLEEKYQGREGDHEEKLRSGVRKAKRLAGYDMDEKRESI